MVKIAKDNGSKIALVTRKESSRMADLADTKILLTAPSKIKVIGDLSHGSTSIQPMTTLSEQSLGIFYDSLVIKLMEEMNETHHTMWARHSNLE